MMVTHVVSNLVELDWRFPALHKTSTEIAASSDKGVAQGAKLIHTERCISIGKLFIVVTPEALESWSICMCYTSTKCKKRDEFRQGAETAKTGVSLSSRLEFCKVIQGRPPTPTKIGIGTVW